MAKQQDRLVVLDLLDNYLQHVSNEQLTLICLPEYWIGRICPLLLDFDKNQPSTALELT